MTAAVAGTTTNPLRDLISDDLFLKLMELGVLDEKGLRDHTIRERFRQIRLSGVSTSTAIEILREDYPYLQFDTLRKIVYSIR
ncbi:MAG TPA: hypothetical protein PLL64_00375 [Rhodothermales bacterium]|mgnify:CR=1 FL=1|nr:hypothetical protein [Bacteroidota bacterium]HRK72699.1 hypothetical protein [Rhodothermales bacterium]HRR08145.1 hypothetical protein [Rhodothermales bacterium]